MDDDPPGETGKTAVCAKCGIDSVIGELSGFPMKPDAFKGLAAHVALADLLGAVGVPTRVPNGTILDEMHLFAKENRLEAPEAFTRVRNAVVHPRRGEKRPSPRLRFEASQLGLWYLQLAILQLLEYDDVYLDRLRLWRGQRVPWQ